MRTILLLVIFLCLFCIWLTRPKLQPKIVSVWLPQKIDSAVFSTWLTTTHHNDLHCQVLAALWRGSNDANLITRVIEDIPSSPTEEQLYKLFVTSYRLHKIFATTNKLISLSVILRNLIPPGWLWANFIVHSLNPKLEGIDLTTVMRIDTDNVDHSFFLRGQIGYEIETDKYSTKDKWGEFVLTNPDKKFPEYLCYSRSQDQHKYQSLWHYNAPLNEMDAFEIIPHLLSLQRKSGLTYMPWICGTRMAGFFPDKTIVFDAKKLFNLPVPFANLEDYKVFSRNIVQDTSTTTGRPTEIYLFSFENGYRVTLPGKEVSVVYGKAGGIPIDVKQNPDYMVFLNYRIYYDDYVSIENVDKLNLTNQQTILKIGNSNFLINKLYAPIIVKLPR